MLLKRNGYERHRELYYILAQCIQYGITEITGKLPDIRFGTAPSSPRRNEVGIRSRANRFKVQFTRDTANCVTTFRGYFEFCIKWVTSGFPVSVSDEINGARRASLGIYQLFTKLDLHHVIFSTLYHRIYIYLFPDISI